MHTTGITIYRIAYICGSRTPACLLNGRQAGKLSVIIQANLDASLQRVKPGRSGRAGARVPNDCSYVILASNGLRGRSQERP